MEELGWGSIFARMAMQLMPVWIALAATFAASIFWKRRLGLYGKLFDSMIGMSLVNKRFDVDLVDANFEVLKKLKREDHGTDEEFEAAIRDVDHRWWTVGKQLLGGRSPNDAISEELGKFGLNK